MLVLARKVGQILYIGDDVTVMVTSVKGNRVSVAIDAPKQVRILRGELLHQNGTKNKGETKNEAVCRRERL